MPKKLQELTISLLTNEHEGFKQLESAVQLLAGVVSQSNLKDLKCEAENHGSRAKQLKKEIQKIDADILVGGLKQLKPIEKELSGSSSAMTAMELAEHVMSDQGDHEWFTDTLGLSDAFIPRFTDADIAEIRQARRILGNDIVYIGKPIPATEDLLDSAMIAAIHNALVTSWKLSEDAKLENIPPLSASLENSVARAKALIRPLSIMADLVDCLNDAQWLRKLCNSWTGGGHGDVEFCRVFQELIHSLPELIEKRAFYVKTRVEIENPKQYKKVIDEALKNPIGRQKSLWSFFIRT